MDLHTLPLEVKFHILSYDNIIQDWGEYKPEAEIPALDKIKEVLGSIDWDNWNFFNFKMIK